MWRAAALKSMQHLFNGPAWNRALKKRLPENRRPAREWGCLPWASLGPGAIDVPAFLSLRPFGPSGESQFRPKGPAPCSSKATRQGRVRRPSIAR